MDIVARFQPRRSGCALLQLVTLLSGCSSWQVQTAATPDVVTQSHPRKLRVTRIDQSQVVLVNPQIRDDTLFGVPSRAPGEKTRSAPSKIALADITRVAIRRLDGNKTGLLILGSLVVAGGVAGLIAYDIAKNSD